MNTVLSKNIAKDKPICSGRWYVYAIECLNKSVYIGQTENLLNRWEQHLSGKGAEWTKKYKPLRLFYWEECDSLKAALLRERALKKTTGRRFLKNILSSSQAGEPAEKLLERIKAEKEKKKSAANSKKERKVSQRR
jgi:predicted GIY-YIG superfamily endonuclease